MNTTRPYRSCSSIHSHISYKDLSYLTIFITYYHYLTSYFNYLKVSSPKVPLTYVINYYFIIPIYLIDHFHPFTHCYPFDK